MPNFFAQVYAALRPCLFCLPAEDAHSLLMNTWQRITCLPCTDLFNIPSPALKTSIFGKTLPHPIGLAAGFDKNADWIWPLLKLGFAAIEVGTITPHAQVGNPKPRLFRLPQQEALINRMGFNNKGLAHALRELMLLTDLYLEPKHSKKRQEMLLGVNIGKGKETPLEQALDDYALCFESLYGLADYAVINTSSPNTPGLRNLQYEAYLAPICERLATIRQLRVQAGAPHMPLLIKVAPDLSEKALQSICAIALQHDFDGLIATNTTTWRPDGLFQHKQQAGGLSGRPLFDKALWCLQVLHQASAGKLTLIGVGGVASAEDVLAMLKHGASLVQVYTTLVYQGPLLVKQLNQQLATLLQQENIPSIQAL